MWQTEYNTAVIKGRVRPTHPSDKTNLSGKRIREQSQVREMDHSLRLPVVCTHCNRPLSRRLDRCDRVIHNESGDPNGGNMCSFSGATPTSRVRHNADYVPYAKIRFYLYTGSTSESRQPHSQLQWRFCDKSLYITL